MKQDNTDISLAGAKIAWVVPRISPGGGGLQTIFRHVTHLQKLGAECHVLVYQFDIADNARAMREILRDSYQCSPDKVFDVPYSDEEYDVAFATLNTTVPYLLELNAKHRAYFVQDYEPYFYAVDEFYVNAEESYRQNLEVITIGRWLVHKLGEDFGVKGHFTEFTADRSIYRPLGKERRKAVCAIFQPDKLRRCYKLVDKTLELVHTIDPEVEIIVYGHNVDYPFSYPVDNRGLITKEQCNELYNECMVGLCISTTNPSRLPFEMMAAGLPVVDIYGDNMLWDFTSDSAVLAEPNPVALATAILSVVEDPDQVRQKSEAGIAFMESRDSSEEQNAMARFVYSLVNYGEAKDDDEVKPMYAAKPVVGAKEIDDVYRLLNRSKLDDALTAPALDCSNQYVKVELSGLPESVDPIDVFFHVWPVFKKDEPNFMRYNARGTGDGTCWIQINFGDFNNVPGLYHCQALCSSIDPVINQCLIEFSFRVLPEDEKQEGCDGILTGRRGTTTVTAETSDKPFAFSVKSAIKETLPEPAVEALRSVIYKLR